MMWAGRGCGRPTTAAKCEAMQSVTADWRLPYGVSRLFRNGKSAGVITKFMDEKRIRSIYVNEGVYDERDFPAPPHIYSPPPQDAVGL